MKLVLLVGLPASGKSTWLARQGFPALSSDAVRVLLTDDVHSQKVNRLVFKTLRYLAKARLEAGAEVTYIDSTALGVWERRCWVRLAQMHGCPIEAMFFDVPLAECKRRNARRARKVPEDVLDKMAARLVPPSVEEGFSRVSKVSDTPAK